MITVNDIVKIGVFTKPHGLKGEIGAAIISDIDCERLECIFVDVDGLFVPFFIREWREKSAEIVLLTIEDIDSAETALTFSGKDIYVLKSEISNCRIDGNDNQEDGFITYDRLVGFHVFDARGMCVGEIERVDDTTDNVLIVITTADGNGCLLPLVEDWIVSIDVENRNLVMDFPDGLLNLNS